MPRQTIDTTTNNGTYIGDPAKIAFGKVNSMTEELYSLVAATKTRADSAVKLSPNLYSPGNDANNPSGNAPSGVEAYAFAQGSQNTPYGDWATILSVSTGVGTIFQIAYSWNYGDSFAVRAIGGAWRTLCVYPQTVVARA